MVFSQCHRFTPESFRLRGAGHRANVGHHRAAISGAYGSSVAYGYAGIQLWMDGDDDGLVLPHYCCLRYCACSHRLASPVYPGHWRNYCTENGIVSLVISYMISSGEFFLLKAEQPCFWSFPRDPQAARFLDCQTYFEDVGNGCVCKVDKKLGHNCMFIPAI